HGYTSLDDSLVFFPLAGRVCGRTAHNIWPKNGGFVARSPARQGWAQGSGLAGIRGAAAALLAAFSRFRHLVGERTHDAVSYTLV
ncbi:hypothetical protein Q8G16_26430, partial [Klebsiella pneumoniae]|uniref:hypothetical protein n=1 Tax=Klebsiella pneumoniae TaxID=573 RepID=UPI002730FEBC